MLSPDSSGQQRILIITAHTCIGMLFAAVFFSCCGCAWQSEIIVLNVSDACGGGVRSSHIDHWLFRYCISCKCLSIISVGLGLLFLHVYHISSVFENATNFSRLTRLERQMLFRDEGALYYYFYQTIAEAKDFPTGLHNIFYNNFTEFPNTINAIERFNVLPEIVIA